MDKFDVLQACMIEMGNYACDAQRQVARRIKADGTVVTETDMTISTTIVNLLHELFPTANVISEETEDTICSSSPLTFVLDPIDGTDVYSQGLPGWCIALGILDQNRKCIGAMVNAPRWGLCRDEGLFLRLDPRKSLLLNDRPFSSLHHQGTTGQTAVSSHFGTIGWKSTFSRKLRCYGSNILHMLSPVLYPYMDSAISTPCFAWDVAAAHAILLSQGMICLIEPQRKPLVYDDRMLVHRLEFEGLLFSGIPSSVHELAQELLL